MNISTHRRVVVSVLVGLCLAATIALVAPPRPASATPVVRNGGTAETAAVSCWAIKQDDPASADGVYWLLTPAMAAPGQFFCDQTTDGGGWVLVGRGREGWHGNHEGWGDPEAVAATPSGIAAFPVSTLAASTVDELLDRTPVRDLVDGIRVRRALDIAGTTYQEVRLDLARLEEWSWAFGGAITTDSITIDGVVHDGGNTGDTASQRDLASPENDLVGVNDERRIDTRYLSVYNWQPGWSYGGMVVGTGGPDTYLYDPGRNGQAQPFAQVFVRPRLTEDGVDWTPIGDEGTLASTRRPVLDNDPVAMSWGVADADPPEAWQGNPHEVLVFGLAEIGPWLYVGGSFQTVVSASGTEIAQPHLARFDAATGAHDPSYAPAIDDVVLDLAALPDGRLAVAGEFTEVNGIARSALAILDDTGAVDETFNSDIERGGATAWVKAVDVEDGFLYAAGRFNRVVNNVNGDRRRVFNVARFDLATGGDDYTWLVGTDGDVADIDAAGDRAYLAGFFSQVNGDLTQGNVGVVDTDGGALVPGLDNFVESPVGNPYQQTILEVGDHVFVGGSGHNAHQYGRSDFSLERVHTTNPAGGDSQTTFEKDGVVYFGCHCTRYNHSDVPIYDENGVPEYFYYWESGAFRVDRIYWMIGYDADTFEIVKEFSPKWGMTPFSEGPWTNAPAADGCHWIGGDVARGSWNGSGYDFASGFTKFCPIDDTAPTSPTNLVATVRNDGTIDLSWNGSTDDASALVAYEILRDDRVVATAASLTHTIETPGAGRFFVRAVDPTGNRSASSSVAVVSADDRVVDVVVPIGSAWSYLDGGGPEPDWSDPDVVGALPTGPAPLGWNEPEIATSLVSGPKVAWLAREFDLYGVDPAAAPLARLRVQADDGVVVRVNGSEVLRLRVPPGPVTPATYSTGIVFGAAETSFTDVYFPTAFLRATGNLVSVALVQGWSNNPDARFAADLVLLDPAESGADDVAPTFGPITADVEGTMVTLTWDPAEDESAIVGYAVSADGVVVDRLIAGTSSVVEQAPESAVEWVVTAFDRAGNATAASVVVDTAGIPSEIVASDATWSYVFDGAAPGDYTSPGFDDTAWAVGAGPLGFGDPGMNTTLDRGTPPRSLAAYFRHTVTLTEADVARDLLLSVQRDDGVAVFVDGVEYLRDNLPVGPLTPGTFASTDVSGAGELTPVEAIIPAGTLPAGQIVIAAEVHQNWRNSPDFRFSLTATLLPVAPG